MKGVVWHTVSIWLIAAGIQAGVTGLILLFVQDLWALILAPITFGLLIFPIAAGICGLRAASGKADLVAALILAGTLSLLWLFIASDGFRMMSFNTHPLMCLWVLPHFYSHF